MCVKIRFIFGRAPKIYWQGYVTLISLLTYTHNCSLFSRTKFIAIIYSPMHQNILLTLKQT